MGVDDPRCPRDWAGPSRRKRERRPQVLGLTGLVCAVARFNDLDDVPRMLGCHLRGVPSRTSPTSCMMSSNTCASGMFRWGPTTCGNTRIWASQSHVGRSVVRSRPSKSMGSPLSNRPHDGAFGTEVLRRGEVLDEVAGGRAVDHHVHAAAEVSDRPAYPAGYARLMARWSFTAKCEVAGAELPADHDRFDRSSPATERIEVMLTTAGFGGIRVWHSEVPGVVYVRGYVTNDQEGAAQTVIEKLVVPALEHEFGDPLIKCEVQLNRV